MKHFAGLDVSLERTSVCIVDVDGNIVRELKTASEPAALRAALEGYAGRLVRVGLEAGAALAAPLLQAGRGGAAGDLRGGPTYGAGAASSDAQQDGSQ